MFNWDSLVGSGMSAVASLASAFSNRKYQRETMHIQNAFNSAEAQKAREWNQQMDNTKYQRQVADMQAAGVNPALAMQGGVTTQATSNATASSASGLPGGLDLSSVMQMAVAMSQLKLQKKQVEADTRLKDAEAAGLEIDNSYKDEFNSLRNEGVKLTNSLSQSQIDQIAKNIEKADAEIDKLKKEAATEEERKYLTIAETSLKQSLKDKTDEERKQIVALLPYQEKLMAAQTQNQKAQASYALVQAAYQQGLIDNHYIEAMVREINNKADESEVRKITGQIENNLNTGNWF